MSDVQTAAPLALDDLHFDAQGLLPAIVQDVRDGEVRMLGFMNREAVERTLTTGQVWFWSRSRANFWRKGETSGNTLTVVAVLVDCDGDALLVQAHPQGPTCHTGARSCFYRQVALRRADEPGAAAENSDE